MEKLKDNLEAIILVGWAFVLFNCVPLIWGIMDASRSRPNQGCNSPKARIEYAMPGYRIGCWLGSPP